MGILEETSGIFGPGKGWSGDGVEQEQIWKGGLQRRCGAGGEVNGIFETWGWEYRVRGWRSGDEQNKMGEFGERSIAAFKLEGNRPREPARKTSRAGAAKI